MPARGAALVALWLLVGCSLDYDAIPRQEMPGRDAGPVDAGPGDWICGACDPTNPLDSCGPGMTCLPDLEADRAECLPGGTLSEGDPCAPADTCAPSLTCVVLPKEVIGTCTQMCDPRIRGSCGSPDDLCFLLSEAGDDCVGICSVPCEPTDLTGAGCGVGRACDLVGEGDGSPGLAFCRPAGDGRSGAACASTNDCAAGFVCTGICQRWCSDAVPCPATMPCTSIGVTLRGVMYGVCF